MTLVMGNPLLGFVTGCFLVLGTWQIGQGLWIYAKSGLSQWLLQRAWTRAEKGEPVARPWPWADTWPVARLEAPAQGVDLIVLEGARARTLAFGPGHLSSSAQAGDQGSMILTGHRDTHFRFLRRLRFGDELRVRAPGHAPHRYEVIETRIVDSRTTRIESSPIKPHLVLVTCYPFDAVLPGGSLRYVVTAVLKRPKNRKAAECFDMLSTNELCLDAKRSSARPESIEGGPNDQDSY